MTIRYKLYRKTKPELTAIQQILYNRGIEVKDQEQWLNAGWGDINHWSAFGDNIKHAAKMIVDHIDKEEPIAILCDEDPDGATSTAIAHNFIYHYAPEYDKEKVSVIFHKNRTHGLGDIDLDSIIYNYKLLWIPDAASNDYEELQYLIDNGVKVVITDHHLAPKILNEKDKIYTINNQCCDYPNKNLSGAGVTWQLCRCIEELYYHGSYCDDYLIDLCAVGCLSDMMGYKSLETRAIVKIGLDRLNNPFLKQLADVNKYTIDKRNGLNYLSAAFGITPFINCCFRSATYEEKTTVINALFEKNKDVKVESSKRGEKGAEVYAWQEAVTIAQRVKRKQTKLQDEAEANFKNKIEENHLLDNSILLLLCEPGEIDKNLAGLLANKYQTKYQRPCAILTRCKDNGKEFYRGSMRNYSLSERTNLKAELEATKQIEWCQGHENSAGLSIPAANIDKFLAAFNKRYESVSKEPVYWVDYIWNMNTCDINKVLDIGSTNIYGQEMPESLVVLQDIDLSACRITLMSKDKNPTLKITLPNGLDIIKFKSSEEEFEEFQQEDMVFTAICKCGRNEWQGVVSGQLLVEDFELREEWIF